MGRVRKTPSEAACANCGASFTTARAARFCPSPDPKKPSPCHVAFGNRMTKRGKVVMPYLMAWIAGKGGGNTPPHPVAGKAMKELTSIVRSFLDEDRAKGRPPATDYAESLFASGILYMDRKPLKSSARP